MWFSKIFSATRRVKMRKAMSGNDKRTSFQSLVCGHVMTKSLAPSLYHEWHAKRGLKQQTEWIDDPSTERAWQQIHEIDRFLVHYRTIQPIIASSHAQSNIASSPIHSNGPTSPDPCPANLKGVPASTWPQSRTAHTPCSLIRWLLSEDQLSIKPLPTTPKTESTSKTAPRDS